MSFSDVFRVEKDVFKFSPDGKYIAYAFQNNVYVRDIQSNRVVRSFPAVDIVELLDWSSDSKFLLCALYRRSIVQVLSLQFPKMKCKIRESDIGIRKAMWSPDGRHILTIGKFNVWVCIWSLSNLSVKYIYNLRTVTDCVVELSPNGKWLAVIELKDDSYCVAIFSTASWQLSKRYPCNKIEIIGGLSWAPDSNAICIWERRVDVCQVLIISLLKNGIITFEKQSLGIKSLSWSPSGQFLALGCYDEKIRLLNNITWGEIMVFEHTTNIDSPSCTVYKEVLIDHSGSSHKKTIFKEVVVRPVKISLKSSDCSERTNRGVCFNCFSACGHFLLSSSEIMPATLWIWNIRSGTLHTFLSFSQPVVDVSWDPCSLRLAVVSTNTNVCLWTPASGASVVQVPESSLWDMCVTRIKWHNHGHLLALNSRKIMTLLMFSGTTEFS